MSEENSDLAPVAAEPAAKPDLLMVTAKAVERLARNHGGLKDVHAELVAAIAANSPEELAADASEPQ